MTTQIQLRRDTAANWTSEDPVLAVGEYGIETDDLATTGVRVKVGDGSTAWTALPYSHETAATGPGTVYPVEKTADESVTNSTTLQSDNELLFPVGAGEVWSYVVYLHLSCASGTSDFKCNTQVPAGATVRRHGMIGGTTTASAVEISARIQSHTSGNLITGVMPSATADMFAIYQATVEVGGTAGDVVFQWAQNNVDGQPLILRRGTALIATRIA